MTSFDLLRVLDLAYRFDGDDATWLLRVAEAMRPALDVGCGIHAFLLDGRDPDAMHIAEPVAVGVTPEWELRWHEDWWQSFLLEAPSRTLHAMMSHSACNHSVQVWNDLARAIPSLRSHLEKHTPAPADTARAAAQRGMRYPDSLNVVALDGTGIGCVFAANRPVSARGPVPRGFARKMGQLATHVAAAYRLRRRRPGDDMLESSEAIIDEQRRVVHATGEATSNGALEAIGRAAHAIERTLEARPQGTAEEGRALDERQALTAGRWTVLEHRDGDGRRYFVARPNAAAITPVAALSERELQVVKALTLGHGNQLIAYELGLSPSLVSKHLASAARKLHAYSRGALAAIGKTLQDP